MKQLLIILGLAMSFHSSAATWAWWPIEATTAWEVDTQDSIAYYAKVGIVTSTGTYAPFWMHTNQQGRISASPYSGYITAVIEKKATCPSRWLDYDWAVDITGTAFSTSPYPPFQTGIYQFPYWQGKNASFQINQLYAHARLFIIDVKAGVAPINAPITHSRLSTGGLLFSGNAMSMPQVSIGIADYMPFPGLFGYLEIKGLIAHAWITDNVYVHDAFLHYKYAGVRLGGKLPINISYELHHAAQWGGYSPIYGDLGNDFPSYINAFFAGAGGSMPNDQLNAQGNHIGVQQLRLDAKWPNWKIGVYWQTIFEDASAAFIGNGGNLPDGLWGIEITQSQWPFINGLCIEYLGTSDQNGPFHDRDGLIFAGNDWYYMNAVYRNGWNYFYRTIGTPFITSPLYNTDGTIHTLNNRAKVWHIGMEGNIYGFQYRALVSYARNYGTYRDADIYSLHSTNTALMFEVQKHVSAAWGLDFGVRLASDIGNQFGNSFGAMITVTKKGLIHTY